MSSTPIVSLSQQPLLDALKDDESIVIHSKEGFKRLNGAAFKRIQDLAGSWEARFIATEEAVPRTLERYRGELTQSFQRLLEAHRIDPNAHQYNKERVGLGKVQDYGIVPLHSEQEGYVLASDVRKYLKPQAVAAVAPTWDTSLAGIASKTAARFRDKLGTSIALGHLAAQGGLIHPERYIAIGAHAEPVASGSVTLGSTAMQTLLAKPLATRADRRDFIEPQPLELGLDFVLRLNPVTAVQDLREDYVDYASLPVPPAEPTLPLPVAPSLREGEEGFQEAQYAYRLAADAYRIEQANYRRLSMEWKKAHAAWIKVNALETIQRDGTWNSGKPRTMIFGDDLRRAAQTLSKVFTGVMNPTEGKKGSLVGVYDGNASSSTDAPTGLDIDHVAMEELVPVLVKAIQELHSYIQSDAFAEGIAEKIYLRKRAARG